MSKESLYQGRRDVTQHFMSPPPPQRHPSHHKHAGHGERRQPEDFSDEKKDPTFAPGDDGASVEVPKKRRGRPPGSKNRPKPPPPPVVITRTTREAEPEPMRPHVIEVPCGRDVAGALERFATRRNLGICVLSATGTVANVSLRHPHSHSDPGGGFVFHHGQYDILTVSATFLPPSTCSSSAAARDALAAAGISVSLAGPDGQIIGGAVAGPLYAATTVVIIAAAFSNPIFHRLSAAAVSVSVSVSAGSSDRTDDHRGHHQQPAEPPQDHHRSGGVLPRQSAPHVAEPASAPAQPIPIYAACQPLPQHVAWPPPPPPPY